MLEDVAAPLAINAVLVELRLTNVSVLSKESISPTVTDTLVTVSSAITIRLVTLAVGGSFTGSTTTLKVLVALAPPVEATIDTVDVPNAFDSGVTVSVLFVLELGVTEILLVFNNPGLLEVKENETWGGGFEAITVNEKIFVAPESSGIEAGVSGFGLNTGTAKALITPVQTAASQIRACFTP